MALVNMLYLGAVKLASVAILVLSDN